MTAPEDKLKTLDELAVECASWRERGLEVVLVNGAFDVLHVGHLRYLAAAHALGDRLVAAVNSDRSVRDGKGELRPIIPESERVEILSHLWMVDRICLFDSLTVGPVLDMLRPSVHAKGTDYTVETVPEEEGRGGLRRPHRDLRRPQGPRHHRSDRDHRRTFRQANEGVPSDGSAGSFDFGIWPLGPRDPAYPFQTHVATRWHHRSQYPISAYPSLKEPRLDIVGPNHRA